MSRTTHHHVCTLISGFIYLKSDVNGRKACLNQPTSWNGKYWGVIRQLLLVHQVWLTIIIRWQMSQSSNRWLVCHVCLRTISWWWSLQHQSYAQLWQILQMTNSSRHFVPLCFKVHQSRPLKWDWESSLLPVIIKTSLANIAWYYACRKWDWINAFLLFKILLFLILKLWYIVMDIVMINILQN